MNWWYVVAAVTGVAWLALFVVFYVKAMTTDFNTGFWWLLASIAVVVVGVLGWPWLIIAGMDLP